MDFGNIAFDLPKNQSNVIKVIGVGGGGSNAINHMFSLGIKGVDFVVCNTDSQALQSSPVPVKIQLGVSLTEGLGAGAKPEIGQQAAIENMADIEKMLDTNTKMVFITAGMGGGTGTGAAPVIAKLAKERDILTVGIVTIPFAFEGKTRMEQARAGVERLRKNVDSMIVINNNKLREVFGNLTYTSGFSKADDVLATAAKGIAEVITKHYTINIDLKDARTVLADSGTAIMGSAKASGPERAKTAISQALDSPLLNDNKIKGSKNVLLLIVSGTEEITFDEIGEITDYIETEAGSDVNVITGMGQDNTLEDAISVTIIATGFNPEQQNEIINTEPNRIIHSLEDDQKITKNLLNDTTSTPDMPLAKANTATEGRQTDIFDIIPTVEERLIPTTDYIKNFDVVFEIVEPEVAVPNINLFEVNEPIYVTFDKPSINFEKPLTPREDTVQLSFEETVIEKKHSLESGIVKHTLEDYLEIEEKLNQSKPTLAKSETDGMLQFSVQEIETNDNSATDKSPVDMTLDELERLKKERVRTIKSYNYKFDNSIASIEEQERTPAYKRMGIELTEPTDEVKKSRTSLSLDSNNDNQIRTNNSFLHDVVD